EPAAEWDRWQARLFYHELESLQRINCYCFLLPVTQSMIARRRHLPSGVGWSWGGGGGPKRSSRQPANTPSQVLWEIHSYGRQQRHAIITRLDRRSPCQR